jgi:hypothetical protein
VFLIDDQKKPKCQRHGECGEKRIGSAGAKPAQEFGHGPAKEPTGRTFFKRIQPKKRPKLLQLCTGTVGVHISLDGHRQVWLQGRMNRDPAAKPKLSAKSRMHAQACSLWPGLGRDLGRSLFRRLGARRHKPT